MVERKEICDDNIINFGAFQQTPYMDSKNQNSCPSPSSFETLIPNYFRHDYGTK
jgi:hypothetical protein